MPEDSELIYCYNLGCEAKKFNPKENKNDSCRHHTLPPFFHDAYKGWSCCKKKVTDFTELFNIKGCALGPHNPVKPDKNNPAFVSETGDDTKKPQQDLDVEKFISAPCPDAHMTRPKGEEAIVPLPFEISKTLETALLKKAEEKRDVDVDAVETETKEIVQGTSCKRNACKAVYEGDLSNDSPCWHHPGIPVFHEGMKYWSCCNRKTSDFSSWEQQAGCIQGVHAWSMEDAGKKIQSCRFDWHQTPGYVFFTMYAKNSVPAASNIEANSVRLTINLNFDYGDNTFTRDINLWHGISIGESKVTFTPNKVEIKMKKTKTSSWARLDLEPHVDFNAD